MSLEELQKDEAFKKQIQEAKSLAEVVEIFKSKGLEVTEEQLQSVLDNPEGEIAEENLESVAGGSIRWWPWPGFPHIPGIFPPRRPWGW